MSISKNIARGVRFFTLVEVMVTVAILGGVIVGILLARNRALAADARANETMACTRLCAATVEALRAGTLNMEQGVTTLPSGEYAWQVLPSPVPEDAAHGLAGYEVTVAPVGTKGAEVAERGVSVHIWLPVTESTAAVLP